ncbi:MAG: response regulator [Alphaproteobacteria bacterium]|nr:MAG: response regulator [Alphaproteobacteria bacterium]
MIKVGSKNVQLSNISVMLIDPDKELSTLIRSVLKSLGFSTIHVARDGTAALNILHAHNVDLIITDWMMSPMDGINFVQKVRRDKDSPNPMVPVIMLTAQAKRWNVEYARDTGMTEFMVKPFTAKQLCAKITRVIESPRTFIVSPQYIGPDRRRKTEPYDADSGERRCVHDEAAIAKYSKDKLHLGQKEHEVFLVDRDFSLKEKIGKSVNLDDIFSEANVRLAQKIIYEAKGDFLHWFANDLKQLEESHHHFTEHHETQAAKMQMAQASLRIKGRAGTFGYNLASQVADALHDVIVQLHGEHDKIAQVIRKHMDAMYVILQQDIAGDGGDIGTALIASLGDLTKKYLH